MNDPNAMSAVEARAEVVRLRKVLQGNDYLAPKRVPECLLRVRKFKILTRSSQILSGLALMAISLGFVLATTVDQPGWLWLSGCSLAVFVGACVATFLLSGQLAKERQMLSGWQDSLDRRNAEASEDVVFELNLYRERSTEVVDELRLKARRNRGRHNVLQVTVIVGSIAVTSLTSIGLSQSEVRWVTVGLSAAVSMAAGIAGFFKYRERGQSEQRTADAIEKELHHLQLGVGQYGGDRTKALRLFAEKVESLREEQRKAELQLDQTSAPHDRAGQAPA